ncbi:MAG: hypothetical protein IJ087_01360 [Eggerthellaceae bacterium]|nr:hypothetical protein [Eggerthellaceae bacterium]
MATATIYQVHVYEAPSIRETGSHWSLEPWGGNTVDFKGEDDGGAIYRLPDGFTVGTIMGGVPAILGTDGYPCAFKDKRTDSYVTHDNYDTPHVIDGNGKTYVLEKA